MTNIDPQGILDRLHELHIRELEARAGLKKEIEADYRKRMESIKIAKAKAARDAVAAGATKGDIGRAMGTMNYSSIDALLDYGTNADQAR